MRLDPKIEETSSGDLLLFLVPRDVERAKAGPCLYNGSIGQRCDRWTRFNGRVDSAVDGGYSVDHFVKFKCFFFLFFFYFFLQTEGRQVRGQ